MPILIADGSVDRIYTKEVIVKKGTPDEGPATSYSLKLSDGEFYSIGWKKPTYGEGDTVQFVYNMNGKYRNATGDVEVISKAEAKPTVATSTTAVTTQKGNREDYWVAKAIKDDEISQRLDIVGSRNTAVNVVKACVELGLLSMPKAKDKGFPAFLAAVDKVQQGFYLHPDNQVAKTVESTESVSEEVVEEAPGVSAEDFV